MILVVSNHRDEHAQSVMVELSRRGAATRLLDLSRFPLQLGLSMHYDGSGGTRFLFGCDDGGLDLDDCGAIWWRRPQPPSVEGAVARVEHQHFALSESHEALQGLWQATDAFWINEPARDVVASRKAYQLQLAGRLGLEIPQTLISNCPQAARDFVQRLGLGRVIYKAFSATEQDWRETRLLREEELAKLDAVKYAPVIFQSYVEADVDLRITVVGDQVFAAAIHSQNTSYKVDFRMDIGQARIEPAPCRRWWRRTAGVDGAAGPGLRRHRHAAPSGRQPCLPRDRSSASQLFIEQFWRRRSLRPWRSSCTNAIVEIDVVGFQPTVAAASGHARGLRFAAAVRACSGRTFPGPRSAAGRPSSRRQRRRRLRRALFGHGQEAAEFPGRHLSPVVPELRVVDRVDARVAPRPGSRR